MHTFKFFHTMKDTLSYKATTARQCLHERPLVIRDELRTRHNGRVEWFIQHLFRDEAIISPFCVLACKSETLTVVIAQFFFV